MLCAQCGKDNPEGARYCNACGHDLVQSMPTGRFKRFLDKRRLRLGGLFRMAGLLSVLLAYISSVIPKFEVLFAQLGSGMPALSMLDLYVSRLGRLHAVPLILCIGLLLFLGARLDYWGARLAGNRHWDLAVSALWAILWLFFALLVIGAYLLFFTLPRLVGNE